MAQYVRGRVLPFPVPPDAQLTAFPAGPAPEPPVSRLLADADVLILRVTHELLRLQRLRTVLSPNQVLRLGGEWALLSRCMDQIEADCQRTIAAQAKIVGLIA